LRAAGLQEERRPAADVTKVAIITGGASGIGLACAERLAADGMKVVIADVNEKTGSEHAKRLGGDFVQADLTKREGCKNLVDTALKKHGTVHVLVNNAGYQHVSPIEDFPEDQWERMIFLMLTAPFLLTRYCWPAMKQQKWGRVVNIASIHALIASPFKAGYISAKHGLVGLTRTAALEGGEHGITVNAICPAYVRTPLVDNQIADQAKANNLSEKEVVEKIMLAPAAVKRLIEPAEVAGFVAYLCGDAAGTITGSALTMDLGWTAR
jgi:3-hydroxybutyrate dehydrogenase